MDWQPWLVFAHVLGAFTFVMAHGVSVFAALDIRGEREPARIAALLDLSRSSLIIASAALAFLLVSGIIAAFVGDFWGQKWIWSSIVILVLLFLYMSLRGTRYHDSLRRHVGGVGIYDPRASQAPPPDPVALARLLDSPRALELAAVGGIGLVAILYLMAFKPF